MNEYLQPFYEHMKRPDAASSPYNPYALPVQLNFLNQRIKMEKEIDEKIRKSLTPKSKEEEVQLELHIVDRSILEDNEIFAKNQLESGLMTQAEYLEYLKVYEKNVQEIIHPDLVVLLKHDVKVLHDRILKRGREMEKDITVEYLQNLQNRYDLGLEPYLRSLNIPFIKFTPDPSADPTVANRPIVDAIVKQLKLPLPKQQAADTN